MDEYRNYLIASKQSSQNTLDKYLISLSSGSLGLSIIFVNNIIKDNHICSKGLLIFAWILFSFTILLVLVSFFSSIHSFSKAISQTDSEKIHDEKPGGTWNIFTRILNLINIIFFIIGLTFLLIFVSLNF
jgi:hypothetical protein